MAVIMGLGWGGGGGDPDTSTRYYTKEQVDVLVRGSSSNSILSFFVARLFDMGSYNESEVEFGLIDEVFSSFADVPAAPPTGPLLPAFAVVDPGEDTVGASLYYWDVDNALWVETSHPWANPIVTPEFIVDLDNGVGGTGNITWAYNMGTVVQISAAGSGASIAKAAFRLHSNTTLRSWDIRRSTSALGTAPTAASFTNVVAAGTFTANPGNWQEVTLPVPVGVTQGESYLVQCYVGSGGKNQSIAAARTSGWFNEDLATVTHGAYRSASTGFPGVMTTPQTINTSTLYGVASLEIG